MQEIIAERAEGSEVWDSQGNRYLDFTSGIGVTSTGHSHPKVVAAMHDQAAKLLFAQQNILPATPATLKLVNHLRRIVPDDLTRFFFCNSGSEAVDNAMKLARAHTGRQNIISFQVSLPPSNSYRVLQRFHGYIESKISNMCRSIQYI